jgi:hypothetical protein
VIVDAPWYCSDIVGTLSFVPLFARTDQRSADSTVWPEHQVTKVVLSAHGKLFASSKLDWFREPMEHMTPSRWGDFLGRPVLKSNGIVQLQPQPL